MAQAQHLSHRPWLAHNSGTEFSAVGPSTRQLTDSVGGRASFSRRVHGARYTSKGERIAEQASRYRGTRYRFGGDSKYKGFDCSGLVRGIYNDLHLEKLPHTSGQLYRMGKPVHLNELRPGDLVFFKNTYRPGISHVGVYAGDNHFIHAQNRRHGVTVTSLADPYYQLHYAGARRLY